MNLDLWSLFIVVVICQGIFVLSVLILSRKKRSIKSNFYLSFIILVFIWFLSEFLSIRNVYDVGLDIFYGTRYGSWLLLGPLTFLYFNSITDTSWRFSPIQLLHFIPFLVFVLIIPLISSDLLSTRQITYGMLAVFDHRKKTVTPFEYLYSVIFFCQFIHLGFYLVYNLKTVKVYANQLKSEYSIINNVIWLRIFNILLISILALASVYLYLLFASDLYRRHLDYIYALPMGLFIYSIGYRLSGIEWLPVTLKNARYTTSSLTTTDKESYVIQLRDFMIQQKPYLKNDLRIKELAKLVDINSHHLSQVINENLNLTFFDFVNQYRVQEAKSLIVSKPELTLLQVAFDAGFNNKTSFVNAFKKFEGETPSTFRKGNFSV